MAVNDEKGNITGYNYFRGLPGGGVSTQFIPAGAGGAKLAGGVIPPKPTAAILSQSQRAQMIEPEVKATSDAVDQVAKNIGPLAGRWSDVMVGRVGADNPQVAQLQLKLELFSTALMQAHGLRGQEFEQVLHNYFRLSQSPEDLKARLNGANDYLKAYIGSTGHGAAKTESAPASNKPWERFR